MGGRTFDNKFGDVFYYYIKKDGRENHSRYNSGNNFGDNQVGDIRVTFQLAPCNVGTVLAVQYKDTFIAYT